MQSFWEFQSFFFQIFSPFQKPFWRKKNKKKFLLNGDIYQTRKSPDGQHLEESFLTL